jgi:hypothetical protein
MENKIYKILEVYKEKRNQHLDGIYREKEWSFKHAFRKKIRPSEQSFIIKELEFQSNLSADIGIENELNKLRGNPINWTNALLLLKNKSERLGLQIDYLNYFHTFLAFALTILILLSTMAGPQNWWLVIIVSGFICKGFSDRANLRRELTIYKEVINLIESNKEKLH